jgi:ATP-dependent Clp protease adapter protein ClpS
LAIESGGRGSTHGHSPVSEFPWPRGDTPGARYQPCPLLIVFFESFHHFGYNVDMNSDQPKRPRVDMMHTMDDHNVTNIVKDEDLFIGDPCKVILYNDDHNTLEHVVRSLMSIFGHSLEMAKMIALEAHKGTKTVAQVETRSRATYHVTLLQNAGLKAEVEAV